MKEPPAPDATAEAVPAGDMPDGMPQSEYTDLKSQVAMSKAMLLRMKKADGKAMRLFLANDLYPLLEKILENTEWYVMDLHTRLSDVESGMSGEGLDEESAGKLVEFIGRTVQLLGMLMNWAKEGNIALPENVVTESQLLVTSAPGLMLMVQELMSEEGEEDEEEEYDDEEESTESEGLVEPGTPVKEEAPAEAAPPAEPPPAEEPPAEPLPAEAAPEPPAEAPAEAPAEEPAVEPEKVELTPPTEGGES